jgi:hypothetical protein
MQAATLGFRAKTGRAIAVALSSDKKCPVFVGRWEILLCDPRIPATGQPYHEVMHLPWAEAEVQVAQYTREIEAITVAALKQLRAELASKNFQLSAIGIVGSPDRALNKIGNPHIRAHAAEGILFRRVLEYAARTVEITYRSFSDKNPEIGRAAGKPWRADERAAAAAAWAVQPLLT